jgi:hypothetical protein
MGVTAYLVILEESIGEAPALPYVHQRNRFQARSSRKCAMQSLDEPPFLGELIERLVSQNYDGRARQAQRLLYALELIRTQA